MIDYLIVGNTLRDTMYCFDYMRRLLRDKIVRASQVQRTIEIDDVVLKFTSEELYLRNDRCGNRAEVISCYYVERLLDMYRTLARI